MWGVTPSYYGVRTCSRFEERILHMDRWVGCTYVEESLSKIFFGAKTLQLQQQSCHPSPHPPPKPLEAPPGRKAFSPPVAS